MISTQSSAIVHTLEMIENESKSQETKPILKDCVPTSLVTSLVSNYHGLISRLQTILKEIQDRLRASAPLEDSKEGQRLRELKAELLTKMIESKEALLSVRLDEQRNIATKAALESNVEEELRHPPQFDPAAEQLQIDQLLTEIQASMRSVCESEVDACFRQYTEPMGGREQGATVQELQRRLEEQVTKHIVKIY